MASEFQPIDERVARVLGAYAHLDACIPAIEFAPIAHVVAPTRIAQPDGGRIEISSAGRAVLSLDCRLPGEFDLFDQPIDLQLADGSTFHTDHATFMEEGASISERGAAFRTKIELSEWEWKTGERPIAWVAVLRGAEANWTSNLRVESNGKNSYALLRLGGNAAWHFLRKGAAGRRTYIVVVDTGGEFIDREKLWHDFCALEFLFGTALELGALVGIGDNNQPVAAYGASFGYRFRPEAAKDQPLPEERSEAWMAVAFPLIVRALSGPDAQLIAPALAGYVDSTVGHIDGQYLFAQVALEALAFRLVEAKPIVKDVDRWAKWVKSLKPVLEQHGVDDSAVNTLAMKLKAAANPTTSSLVRRAMRACGIEVPPEGLAEIRGRDVVAHTFSMNGGEPHEIERDLRRIRIVRTLLAALLLGRVGYGGALADWDLDERRWRKRAEWFPIDGAAREAARIRYSAVSHAAGK